MPDDAKRPLGKILLQKKLVSQADLDAALRAQKRPGENKPLASVLTESGAVAELDALQALSEQHGVPGIDLGQVVIALEHLALIPREVSESNLIVCVLARGEKLFLGMANPGERRVIDEVEFVTGRKVYPYVALTTALKRTIAAAYDALLRGDRYFVGPRAPQETLRQLGLEAPHSDGRSADHGQPNLPNDAERTVPLSKSVAPGAPAVVVADAVRGAGAMQDAVPTDLASLSRDLSAHSPLPEESRPSQAGLAMATPSSLQTQVPDRAPVTEASSRSLGKTVLVADDDDEVRNLLKRLLTSKGYRVLAAEKGQLALRIVRDHTPDAILMDAMLPEIHGFDIARRIKGSERYGHIPIILVSAAYKGWRIADDMKATYGVDEYLEKPFRIIDVLRALGRVLEAAEDPRRTPESRDPEALLSEAEQALNSGIESYKTGDIDGAIAHLQRGIDIDPLAYRLRFHLALLYGKRGLIYEGIQELERAVDLNPKHFAALKNLAVLYEKAGFKHKAVEVWTRCALIAPDDETRGSVKKHLVELL